VPGFHVLDQLLQGQAPANAQATFALIRIGAYDLNAAVGAAYSRILSAWFSVEYCWCSVDIRTYSAASWVTSSIFAVVFEGVA
jgi:hypothetical protein